MTNQVPWQVPQLTLNIMVGPFWTLHMFSTVGNFGIIMKGLDFGYVTNFVVGSTPTISNLETHHLNMVQIVQESNLEVRHFPEFFIFVLLFVVSYFTIST